MKKFIIIKWRGLFKNRIFIIISSLVLLLLAFFVAQFLLLSKGVIKPIIYNISIKAKMSSINKNETTKLIANVGCVPFYANNNIVYVSDEPMIATVTDDGVVKGISAGTTKIKAKLGGMVAETNINVSSKTLLPFAQGKYLGEIKNLRRDGNGIMYYENGNLYEGFWKDDVINDYGVMIWKNKNKYDGNWKNEQFDGFGKFETKEYIYTGAWSNGQFNGYGEITWKNGNSYKGYWLNGQLDSYGVFIWNRMDQYSGEWKNGSRNGFGEYIYSRNQNKYLGNWIENFRDGYGIEYRNNFKYYEGYWKSDKLNGKGTLYRNDMVDYVGEFVNDKPDQ